MILKKLRGFLCLSEGGVLFMSDDSECICPPEFLSVSLDRHASGVSISTTIRDLDELEDKLALLLMSSARVLELMTSVSKNDDGGTFV